MKKNYYTEIKKMFIGLLKKIIAIEDKYFIAIYVLKKYFNTSMQICQVGFFYCEHAVIIYKMYCPSYTTFRSYFTM